MAIISGACKQDPVIKVDGGHRFSKHISKTDSSFWRLPVRDSLSTKDSFLIAYFGRKFYLAYDEPNISLAPWPTPVFRLLYSEALGDEYIITISPIEIVIKKRGSVPAEGRYDEMQLSETERLHYRILERSFPIQERKHKERRKKYLDSMVAVYPQLLDPQYYVQLLDKTKVYDTAAFKYSTIRKSISEKEFVRLAEAINASGFWKLPYSYACSNVPMDGAGITLEGNAGNRYNIVNTPWCEDDNRAFIKACTQLVELAGMQKEIIFL
jgi:hypothetical protein